MMAESNLKVSYDRLQEIIDVSEDFLIITHVYPDGDALGSLTAFHNLLIKLGKNSKMLCKSMLPYQYKFLPFFSDIKENIDKKVLDDKKLVCIFLDCADENRAEQDFGEIRGNVRCIVNIDHHGSNTCFGDIDIVDSRKSATAEILYEFISDKYRSSLDHNIAISLYVGILTDTGRFQYSNTTANIHKITSELLQFGILPSEVCRYIYESDPVGRFKLIQTVFGRIRYIKSLSLIYSYVLNSDFKELKIPFYSQDGIIELLRSAEGIKVTALIKQIDDNSYKISLRTSDSVIDLSDIAVKFGGGGHSNASGYKDKGSLRSVMARLEKTIKDNTGP
ncbi:MAG: bifunctional oligoribonuclease/PAP phosphatase NrnA [Actinobacteria bacterium]|nr:bifunctional oligoribonuclease/PAP phosphatase NrnA [Actinomycetota bacterium]